MLERGRIMKRDVIIIDEEKCNGCGACIPNCPEGALQIINGKVRLVSDLLCDGLGACIGHCPQGAITIEKREAVPYDEKKTMKNIVKAGADVIQAHLEHLKSHKQDKYLAEAMGYLKANNIKLPKKERKPAPIHAACGCPGSKIVDFRQDNGEARTGAGIKLQSELRTWPIQLHLVNPSAPYFENSDIVIAADCAAFSYADFHRKFLKGKVPVIFCPKLDNSRECYIEKLAEIFKNNTIRSVSIVHMEVPCCFGVEDIVSESVAKSGKNIKLKEYTISIKGELV
jgi:NAD-dependent dihydropyrimidine dehydrogenase PreA subunit